MSTYFLQKEPHSHMPFCSISLLPEMPDTYLHTHIAQRVAHMLDDGLVEEVYQLKRLYPELTEQHTSMRAIGYRECWQHLDHSSSLDTLKDNIVRSTQKLIKKQKTWLKRFTETHCFYGCEKQWSHILPSILELIQKKLACTHFPHTIR